MKKMFVWSDHEAPNSVGVKRRFVGGYGKVIGGLRGNVFRCRNFRTGKTAGIVDKSG
jgi:hypothetical protein